MTINPNPIAEFRDGMLDTLGSKSAMVVNYARRVLRFAEGLGVATTADLTPEFLDRLVAKLYGDGLRDSTIQTYMCAFKRVCAAAVDCGYLASSPFESRPAIVARYRRDRITTNAKRPGFRDPTQFKAVMGYLEARAADRLADHRLFALVAVLAYTGVSHYDAAMLRTADVDLARESVRFPHRQRRTAKPAVVPIPAELVRILTGWLKRPFSHASYYGKLGEHEVIEARRLWAEGWKIRAIAERFGTSRTAISRLLSGHSYACVAKEGEARKTIADLQWLFPAMKEGPCRPWVQFGTGPQKDLKAAGKAAGVDNLVLSDMKYIYKHVVVPDLVTIKPDQAAPLAQVSPVLLGSLRTPPVVLGDKDMPLLTEEEYNALFVLVKFHPNRVSLKRLIKEKAGTRPDRIIKNLAAKHILYAKVLDIPPPRSKFGWGLRWP